MRLRIGMAVGFALIIVPTLWGQSKETDVVEIALPGETWSMAADLKGLKIEKNGMQEDGRYYLMAHNDQSMFALSIYLEKVPGTADPAGCRDSLAEKARGVQSVAHDVRISESGPTGFLEYRIDEFQGVKVNQKHEFACLARDDVYVDAHASKTLYESKDEARLQSLLQSLHFVNSAQPEALDAQLKEGSKYYLQGDYPHAIEHYESVFEAEKAHPGLAPTSLRVLVDNLGMAYGITGNLLRAKEIFEYGVSRDPTYPLFYYNLACTYAELDNLGMTKENLTRAFQYRRNMIAGEKMPDPRQDSSFQNFMQMEDFRKFLDDLMAHAK